MSDPVVSVVIPAHNERENLADTVDCVLESAGDLAVEVIVVDDGSTDGSGENVRQHFEHDSAVSVLRGENLGVPGARNLGARHAQGEVLIFLDAHCYTPPGWMQRLIAPLEKPGVGIVGPAIANLAQPDNPAGCGAVWSSAALDWKWLPCLKADVYPVPLLPGGCQAVRRADFVRLGGFDAGMTRWGSQDYELTLHFWLMGYEAVGQPRSVIYHLFHDHARYRVDYDGVIYNRLRLALLHFSDERCARVIDHLRGVPGFSGAIMRLLSSDTIQRREQLRRECCRDDDWYFSFFGHVI